MQVNGFRGKKENKMLDSSLEVIRCVAGSRNNSRAGERTVARVRLLPVKPKPLPLRAASPLASTAPHTCASANKEPVTCRAAAALAVLHEQSGRKEEVKLEQLPCWPGLPCKLDFVPGYVKVVWTRRPQLDGKIRKVMLIIKGRIYITSVFDASNCLFFVLFFVFCTT